MPGEQGRRRHAEGCPPGTGEEATHGAKECTIGWLEPLPPDLAPEQAHLVTKREQLDLLGAVGASHENNELQRPPQREVDERPQLASGLAPSHRGEGSGA
jgi:hypothetical protein